MRRAAIAVALVAVALPATAFGQLDPRETSGIARAQPGDPPGQLTVRVIQGGFEQDQFGNTQTKFSAGQVVHLVAVGSNGSIGKLSRPVDDGGRAVFQGLATDGSYSYFVMALLPRGDTQDRLMTEAPIVMPPQAGMRMILAGHDPASPEPAIDELNDPRLPPLDPGDVIADVRGMFEGVEQITLREVGSQWTKTVRAQALQDARVARFSGVPVGNEHIYVAEVVVEGRVYRSMPIQLTSSLGGYGSIFVYPNLLVQFHSGAEVDDQKLWFQIQFTIANGTGTPFNPGPEGIFIPLPRGAMHASVSGEDPRVAADKERGGFVWKGSFPPGQEQFIGQFALPIDGGEVELVMDLPYGAIDSQLSMRTRSGIADDVERCGEGGTPRETCTKRAAAGLVDVAWPEQPPMRFSTLDGGVTFLVLGGLNVRAGEQLKMTFKGLPSPPAWIGFGQVATGVAVLFFVALGIAGVFWYRGKAEALADARRAELTIERNELFEQLVKLERGQRDGRVPDTTYTGKRGELKSQLVKIDGELRELR